MQLAIEYMLCYSGAFGVGFLIGLGTAVILHHREQRKHEILSKRMKQIRRDNGRRNYG